MTAGRFVEVAVDAPAAAGDRAYTYRVPDSLADLEPGEAVIVEFGRRQALGVVLGDATAPEGFAAKPVAARVRSDGPLLPPVTLALVRLVARTYLAPVALVVRAALPPGLLERLALVAVAPDAPGAGSEGRAPSAGGPLPRETVARSSQAETSPGTVPVATEAGGSGKAMPPATLPLPDPRLVPALERIAAAGAAGVPVRSLPWDAGRAALVRELRALEGAGLVRLEWRLSSPAATPRLERRVAATDAGRAVGQGLREAAEGAGPERGGAEDGAVAGEGGAIGADDGAVAGGVGAIRPEDRGRDGGGGAIGPEDRGRDGAGTTIRPEDRRSAAALHLGIRQRAVLDALAAVPAGETAAAAALAAEHGAGAISSLARRGLVTLTVAERPRLPLAGRPPGPRGALPAGLSLTPEQARAARTIVAAVRDRRPGAFLLDGVTGGGRTAVYASAIAAALEEGRDALVLVPEIALAVPLVDRLRAELGVEAALVHGGLSEGERADEWRRIRAGDVRVVVGTRTAVLAPLADPGIVVVDEEHEGAYKSDRTPRLQARDVALALGTVAGAPVVLGSATPDVGTYGRAVAGEIERIELRERASGRLPEICVVDLRAELAAGNRGLLSRPLADALAALDREAGERAILVINRRGSATVVLCRDCGYVQVCPECRRPLVYHAVAAALRCHHCGATAPLASRCPACGSPRIRYLGGGTERLEREVRLRFPGYRVGRLDRDVLVRRGAAERVLDDLRDGRIDVLVGTGLVAKGIDVPEVTLVGVVSADIALNLPDVRAAERTYQLLAQAVGRAGRGERPGRAFVQTYQPEHPAVVAVGTADPRAFYEAELATRRAFGLPPYGRLVKLTVALEDRDAAEAEAERMASALRERAASGHPADAAPGPAGGPVEVLGPVPAYVARRGGRWRFHLVLRGADPVGLLGGEPGQPWSVDVDPESLL